MLYEKKYQLNRKLQNYFKKLVYNNRQSILLIINNVLGASDGIGKQFAFDLAKQGINIFLIGRNEQKIKKVQSELQQCSPKIQIKYFILDFSLGHSEQHYKKCFDEISQLDDIALLINNAGVGGFRDFFLNYSEELLTDMITVNCYSICYFMKLIVPLMLARQGRSGIINVSSVSGIRPLPFLSVYSSTKGFCDFISRAVAQEQLHKIDILSLRPNFVATKMTNRQPGGQVLTTEECTTGCMQHLGFEYFTDGHWKRIILIFYDCQLDWIYNYQISLSPTCFLRNKIIKQIALRKKLAEQAKKNN